jgi:transcriptional regulator with XRE-family HTH domain
MTSRNPRRRHTVFVGSKIKDLRKERDLTQSELASRIGVQQSDLCRMEKGEYKVSLDTLFRILAVFGMEIGDFFGDKHPAAGPTESEHEILRLVRRLDDTARAEIIDFIRYKAARPAQTWKR